MSRTIWKYPLPREKQFTLSLPHASTVLAVQMQEDEPTLWARVNPDFKLTAWAFDWIATGEEIRPNLFLGSYLGTVQVPPYVFHLFGRQVEDPFKKSESEP